VWALADGSQILEKVVRTELYSKWKSKSWIPSFSQTEVLNQIIGTFSYCRTNLYFPCQIRLPDQTLVSKAILTATKGDSFGRFPEGQEVRLLEDTYEILASEYALPAAVRKATRDAEEQRMAYAPTNVKDASGQKYTLTHEMDFFELGDVFGPEITLDDSPYHGDNRVYPQRAEMYFICDMFEGATID